MYYAEIKWTDIANGEGVRISLFVSGCTHHCKNCFNQIAWDFRYGHPFDEIIEEKILRELGKPYIAGLSLLGGEPLEPQNQEALLPFVKAVKKKYPGKDIWSIRDIRGIPFRANSPRDKKIPLPQRN